MTGHPANCRECQPCQTGCGQPAFCLSEIAPHPCPHNGIWCEDDRIENCADCRAEAEKDMYLTGTYSAEADPFVNHKAPPPVDRIARDGGYHWDGRWIEVKP